MVPAHAGVILKDNLIKDDLISGSRTRGGDPKFDLTRYDMAMWFPHTRG